MSVCVCVVCVCVYICVCVSSDAKSVQCKMDSSTLNLVKHFFVWRSFYITRMTKSIKAKLNNSDVTLPTKY